jgi:hypothetical protein
MQNSHCDHRNFDSVNLLRILLTVDLQVILMCLHFLHDDDDDVVMMMMMS